MHDVQTRTTGCITKLDLHVSKCERRGRSRVGLFTCFVIVFDFQVSQEVFRNLLTGVLLRFGSLILEFYRDVLIRSQKAIDGQDECRCVLKTPVKNC